MTRTPDLPAPDPDRIARAVEAVPGVVRLHGGRFGEVATYLPGRRVVGVQVGDQRISVHLAAHWGSPLHDLAAAVRRVVRPLAGVLPIDVTIEDVLTTEEIGAAATGYPAGVP